MITSVSNQLAASPIAMDGLQQGYKQLEKISQDINQSFVPEKNKNNIEPVNDFKADKFEELNKPSLKSLESSLIGSVQTETQMQALLKVLQVEKQLFDNSIGKIFDIEA